MHLAHDWYPQPLPENVQIGEGSWLHSSFSFSHFCSRRQPAVWIGKSCGVYKGSFFDLGPEGEFELGDFSTLVGVIVATNGHVRIGNYCFLAHEVLIADESVAAPFCRRHPEAEAPESPKACVTLGDDVWVGAGAVLLRGADIGDGSIVGAAAVAGNPARVVGTIG